MKNKELLNKIKQEFIYILMLLVIVIIIFKVVFYNESFLILSRTVIAFFWLFIIPGFSLMYYWHDLSFLERFLVGIALSTVTIGIFGYYLGLAGLHAKYHTILLPLIALTISFFIISKK